MFSMLLTSFSIVFPVLKNIAKNDKDDAQAAVEIDPLYGRYKTAPTYGDHDQNMENGVDDVINNYNNKLCFHIYGWWGLNVFRQVVSSGYLFEGKEVYLWSDITPPNENNNYWIPIGVRYNADGGHLTYISCASFAGKFYGGGYTLSGFSCYYNGVDGWTMPHADYGLFGSLSQAYVTNVKLKNFNYYDWANRAVFIYAGCIAASAYSSTISNCIVENFTFFIRSKPSQVMEGNFAYSYIGGIVGRGGDCVITNCLVDRITNYLDRVEGHKESQETVFSNFGPASGYGRIENCAVRDMVRIVFTGGNWWDLQKEGDFWNAAQEDVETVNVFKDTDGGKLAREALNGNLTSAWHAPTDGQHYNNFPYLKSFLNLKSYNFKPGDQGKLTAETNLNGEKEGEIITVEVPTDVSFTLATSSLAQNVYGVTIMVEDIPEHYKLLKWVKKTDDGTYYQPQFERIKFDIIFKALHCTHGGTTYNWSATQGSDYAACENKSESVTIKNVKSGSVINVTSGVNKVTYCIVEPDGNKIYVYYNFSAPKNVAWTYYKLNDLTNKKFESGEVVPEVAGGTLTIAPTLTIKTYGVIIN